MAELPQPRPRRPQPPPPRERDFVARLKWVEDELKRRKNAAAESELPPYCVVYNNASDPPVHATHWKPVWDHIESNTGEFSLDGANPDRVVHPYAGLFSVTLVLSGVAHFPAGSNGATRLLFWMGVQGGDRDAYDSVATGPAEGTYNAYHDGGGDEVPMLDFPFYVSRTFMQYVPEAFPDNFFRTMFSGGSTWRQSNAWIGWQALAPDEPNDGRWYAPDSIDLDGDETYLVVQNIG
jgi:hypothetical protein